MQDLHQKTQASSDSSSDSDAAAKQSITAAATKASTPAAGAGAAATGDGGSSSDDDEGLDDEAMLRLDAQLGAAVRASLSRGGGGAKERAAALLALQLRVAALLEDWIKKVRMNTQQTLRLCSLDVPPRLLQWVWVCSG